MTSTPVTVEHHPAGERHLVRGLDLGAVVLSIVTLAFAVLWSFPLYWALVTTFKPEFEVVRPYIELWPETFTIEAYVHIIQNTQLGRWYINSIITAGAITAGVIIMGASCGYAISQLNFPGRRLLWWIILASFMVPIPALIVNHFIIIAEVKLLNTLTGVVLPQLIAPVTVSSTSSSSTRSRAISAKPR